MLRRVRVIAAFSGTSHNVIAAGSSIEQRHIRIYCISCHAEEKAKRAILLDRLRLPIGNLDDAELWYRVMEALQFGEMPPDNAGKFPTRPEARQALS